MLMNLVLKFQKSFNRIWDLASWRAEPQGAANYNKLVLWEPAATTNVDCAFIIPTYFQCSYSIGFAMHLRLLVPK